MKLKILSVGKTKEPWLEEALEIYLARLRGMLEIEFTWLKNDGQLASQALKGPAPVCLDPNGALMDSEAFSCFFQKKMIAGGSRMTMVIGGAEGLPLELKQKCELISLSPLTFTHQLTRLILIEQIYRAMEILKGSKYHKR